MTGGYILCKVEISVREFIIFIYTATAGLWLYMQPKHVASIRFAVNKSCVSMNYAFIGCPCVKFVYWRLIGA
jgi:nitrous oxide reductase